MWYVVWTSTGSENKAKESIEGYVKRCFVPRKVVNIKRQGKWVITEKALFPGYLLVDTDDAEDLAVKLRNIEGFSQLLTTDKKLFPLYDNDEIFVEKLYNEKGIFDMSEGYIEGDHIKVTSGPLCGLEGLIKKIDRHKRLAQLELKMFGRTINTSVGLEITEKR